MMYYNTAHGPVSFSPLDVVIDRDVLVGFLHGTRIFNKKKYNI